MNSGQLLKKTIGETLEKSGHKLKNLIVLDSDIKNGLATLDFAKVFPDRHFSVPMGENTMLSMAAGMSIRGKITVCSGEAHLILSKGFESLRNSIAYPNLNIKILAGSCGISNIEEGPARISIEDLGILNTLPNFQIFMPADHFQTKAIIEHCLNIFDPCYIRIPKIPVENIFDESYQFTPGKPEIVKEGTNITIISYGLMLHESLKAAYELEKRGASTQVLNLSSLKPINEELLLEKLANSQLIFVIEDQAYSSGLYSEILNIFNKHSFHKKLHSISLKFPLESGRLNDILAKQQLDFKSIYEHIKNLYLSN